jgi:hypothetical protein
MTATPVEERTHWLPKGPLAVAFIAGLIVGPMLTSAVGLTVTSRTASARAHDGMLELQAQVCDARARVEVADPTKLDSSARRDLAAKHAQTQSSGVADYEIIGLCANKLGG